MENNELIKYEGGLVKRVGNAISVTNKLIEESNEILAKELLEKARVCYWNKNYKEAIEYCDKAIRLRPNWAEAYGSRSSNKKHFGDLNGAHQDITMKINIETDWRDYDERALIRKQLKDYKGAIEDFSLAIEIGNGNHSVPFSNRAKLKHELKDYKGAVEDYNKALKIATNSIELHIESGNAKFDLRDYVGAVKDFSRSIELLQNLEERPKLYEIYAGNDNKKIAHFNRGLAKKEIGNNEGACKDWSIACDLGHKDSCSLLLKYCVKNGV